MGSTPMTQPERQIRTFAGLRRLIAVLRSPDGCPWDRVQTHQSLRHHLTEEASETLSALDEGDPAKLKEELGDLLLQIVLQTQISEESREFVMADVIEGIATKLVRRHPHVFGEAVAETPDAVVEQWEEIKRGERNGASALAGVPPTLPALSQAQTIQRRAGKTGFQWDTEEQAWDAVHEELSELRAAATPEERRAETGDALFALANLARFLDVDAEEALRSTCGGFSKRFRYVEQVAGERSVDLLQADLQTKLTLWEEAKSKSPKQYALKEEDR
ncbi:MAG: nucleoside triphosphate pyrophosphohydrolase [Dehalococcoidia bacterium]